MILLLWLAYALRMRASRRRMQIRVDERGRIARDLHDTLATDDARLGAERDEAEHLNPGQNGNMPSRQSVARALTADKTRERPVGDRIVTKTLILFKSRSLPRHAAHRFDTAQARREYLRPCSNHGTAWSSRSARLPFRVLNRTRWCEDIAPKARLSALRRNGSSHAELSADSTIRHGRAPLNHSEERIRILIVDDHPVMRGGLRAVVEQEADLQVVGEAGDGAEAIEQFRRLLPDVTLLDLQMPRVDGLQAITTIHHEYPDACIVVLTTYPGDARVTRAMTLGATSYLLKTAGREEILRAIRSAMHGHHVVAPEVAQEMDSHRGSEGLTIRELSVLRLVAEGKSNRSIAEALYISEDTVKARMKSLMAKLGAADRTHAVTIAMRRGFIDS